MKMNHWMARIAVTAAAVMAQAAIAAPAPAPAADDSAPMIKLATDSGCMTCHRIEAGSRAPQGQVPIGPAWRDVAQRYRGVAAASDTLTRVVMTGSNPYSSHWKGQVSGLAMPPNAVAITETDAKRLVTWILALEPAR